MKIKNNPTSLWLFSSYILDQQTEVNFEALGLKYKYSQQR